MAYIYIQVDNLQGTKLIGTHECVALVQHYARAPTTTLWRQGLTVRGNPAIKKGTAIATFVDGKYPRLGHNNHAAFYISQDAGGITVMDQWRGDKTNKPTVSTRYIPFRGKNKDGTYLRPSNNADAFSIIE
jgi:hypothetical protein